MFEQEARERQINLANTRPNTKTDLTEKLPEGNKGEARQKASKLFNINPRYISDIKKIDKEYSDLVPKIKTGELKN